MMSRGQVALRALMLALLLTIGLIAFLYPQPADSAWWWCNPASTPVPTATQGVPTAVATASNVWTKSTGATAGSLECITYCSNSGGANPGLPPGWFEINTDLSYSTGQHMGVLCHVDLPSEPATTTFASLAGGNGTQLCGALINGVRGYIDANAVTAQTLATTAPVYPAYTSAETDILLYGACNANIASNSSFGTPTGVTLAVTKGAVSGVSAGCFLGYILNVAPGTTASKTGSVSTTADVGTLTGGLY